MKKTTTILATLVVAVLFSSAARASEPTVEEMIAYCRAKFRPTEQAAVAQCVTQLHLGRGDARHADVLTRLDAGEARDRDLLASLGAGKERDEEILSEVRELSGRVDDIARDLAERPAAAPAEPKPAAAPVAKTQPAAATSPAPAVAPATTSVVAPAFYAGSGGVPYAVVPHRAWVSIYNLESMVADTMHIRDLGSTNARERCGGQGAVMVMFTDHGSNITNIWAPPGASTSGFSEVYYDSDGDGVPEGGTVFALPLATQDDVWVSWGRQDDIRMIYLRPSGQVAVQGLGYKTLYRPSDSRDNPASGAVACDMDELDPKTGHPSMSAGSMSRAW